mmetsp:Transcript_59344/g.139790  ORF Transcript_59344/g.139790 Transcript_59344/m.139790 type:complete len:439 (-) Transcript_59344:1938-3254(-)
MEEAALESGVVEGARDVALDLGEPVLVLLLRLVLLCLLLFLLLLLRLVVGQVGDVAQREVLHLHPQDRHHHAPARRLALGKHPDERGSEPLRRVFGKDLELEVFGHELIAEQEAWRLALGEGQRAHARQRHPAVEHLVQVLDSVLAGPGLLGGVFSEHRPFDRVLELIEHASTLDCAAVDDSIEGLLVGMRRVVDIERRHVALAHHRLQELAAVLEDGGEGGASEAPDQPELLLGRQLARRAREVMHSGVGLELGGELPGADHEGACLGGEGDAEAAGGGVRLLVTRQPLQQVPELLLLGGQHRVRHARRHQRGHRRVLALEEAEDEEVEGGRERRHDQEHLGHVDREQVVPDLAQTLNPLLVAPYKEQLAWERILLLDIPRARRADGGGAQDEELFRSVAQQDSMRETLQKLQRLVAAVVGHVQAAVLLAVHARLCR